MWNPFSSRETATTPEQETRYRQLRRPVENGYQSGSIIEIRKYSEPLPASLSWLQPPAAVPYELPPGNVVDGFVDVEEVRQGEALVLEAEARSREVEKRWTRSELKARYAWSDAELNISRWTAESCPGHKRNLSGSLSAALSSA
jgi:hypothetical protein